MTFISEDETGQQVSYIDRKRYLWPLALLMPMASILALGLYVFGYQHIVLLLAPVAMFYLGLTGLDLLCGRDSVNPPDAVTPLMSQDKYYDYIAYAYIPTCFVLYGLCAALISRHDIPFWALVLLVLGVATINSNVITIAHELGHRSSRTNRFFTKFALTLSAYGHYTLEHNRGHHVTVSTPEDIASARYNETVYRFALREIPGEFIGGWNFEAKRLAKKQLPLWHWKNDILQVYAATVLLSAGLIFAFGWRVLPFIIAHHFIGWFALTLANYIEHYGLLRQKRANGKYEPCAPRHSWNANNALSNIMSLHLQRHSDHHANPSRPYQVLRDLKEAPLLPFGYPACFMIAMVPPLWFKMMNPRVLNWAGGDLEKVNQG